jgi:HSP20 family protein
MEITMSMKSLIPWGREMAVPATRDFDEPAPFLALHRQMNRLFDDFFHNFGLPLSRGWSLNWPSVEVSDGDKEVKVVAELPGLDEKDIDITLRDGVLTLKGEKKQKSNGATYSERWHGQFARSIQLGPDVDPDKVKASFEKGVLTATLEKRPDAQSQLKRIATNES